MTDYIDIEVCLDCHLAHHTGDNETGTEWNLLEPGETVTDNTVCGHCFDSGYDCEHNTQNYSWTRCGGCGSTLAGYRFDYALWLAV